MSDVVLPPGGAALLLYDPISGRNQVISVGGGVTDHGALTGLNDDDHAEYLRLTGRAGGQTVCGGNASGNNLVLKANSVTDLAGRVSFMDGSVYIEDHVENGMQLNASSLGASFADLGTCKSAALYLYGNAPSRWLRLKCGTTVPVGDQTFELHLPATGADQNLFMNSGKVDHESGGLEADISAYSNEIPYIVGGQTFPVHMDAVASLDNCIINGSGFWWSRYAPGTAKAMTDDTYDAPDRWYSITEGANPTIQRDNGPGTGAISGAATAIRLNSGGTTNRFGIAQIVPYTITTSLRGKAVRVQLTDYAFKNAGSGTIPIGFALLAHTGTPDVVTSDAINNWASTTYTPGNFFIAGLTVVAASTTINASHNTWVTRWLDATVPTNATNLILVAWTRNAPAHANDHVRLTEFGIYRGAHTRSWQERSQGLERALCQHFFYSSYPHEVAPGSAGHFVHMFRYGTIAHTQYFLRPTFPKMRTTPACNIWSYNGTASDVSDGLTGADKGGCTIAAPNVDGFLIQNTSGGNLTANHNLYIVNFIADAEL